ncbi:uncharacterized protein DUF3617 [Iodobacter fluviatilis]|uniref:Protein of uncharacterized function (DUF3617) n=1 Tax=Iodobacter fluviatilis TaxID=537 RepID=A0A377SRJ2_9NEIS|nr:DUF3617 family protein [Iodobacter fluviatilis]TCU86273.1 uncharacterized protein DUF3617 [Iodobacter fluviatilis]STR44684.1 Protein of uncharacterised function (DUF3617) [Iodobacter fluviatilis]
MRFFYALLFINSATFAAGPVPQLGQWEITSEMLPEQKAMMSQMKPEMLKQMQQPNMRFDPKAGNIIMSSCLSKDKEASWQLMVHKQQKNCDMPKISNSGNTVIMDMQCHQPQPSAMHSVIQFSPARDSYQFEHQIKAQDKTMTVKGSARRLGDCK